MKLDLEALAAQVMAAQPRAGKTRVVAIDGPAGSGKTTLAAQLTAQLDGATVLNMDSLYPGWDGLAQGAERLVSDLLAPLAAGQPAVISSWNWIEGRQGPAVTLAATELLIVDGCGSGTRAAAPMLSLLIWMDGDPAERRRRAIARDGEMFAPQWERWAAQEQQLFARERPHQRADLIIIDGDQQQST